MKVVLSSASRRRVCYARVVAVFPAMVNSFGFEWWNALVSESVKTCQYYF
jgi:hypothetical protein